MQKKKSDPKRLKRVSDSALGSALKKRRRNPAGVGRRKKARRPLNRLSKQRPYLWNKLRANLLNLNVYDRRTDSVNVKLVDHKGRRLRVGDGHIVTRSLYDIVR